MKEFPNKILLSQDIDTKEIFDSWVLHDYTDNITNHLRFEDDGWHTDAENYKSTLDRAIEDLKNHFYE